MAQYITRIRTESGDLQIDYNALANLPLTDTTLNVEGQAADAYATGVAINEANTSASNAQTTADEAKTAVEKANEDIVALSARVDLLSGDDSDVDFSGLVQKAGDKMTGPLETPGLTVAVAEDVDLWPYLAFGYYQDEEFKTSSMIGSMSDQHTLTISNICTDDAEKGEYYYLPVADTGRTENGVYQILTTKAPVAIEQGGTGVTTLEGLKSMLGVADTTGVVAIENGGTGANNALDAITNLGLADALNAVSFVKLWENAQPAVAFKDQTIYVDGLANYEMIAIETNHNVHIVVTNGTYQSLDHQRGLSLDNFQTYARNLEAYKSNNTIHFYDCYYRSTSGNTIEKTNNVMIPIRIYGMKNTHISSSGSDFGYALNLAEDGRILSVTYPQYAPEGATIVYTLPEGNLTDYIYSNGEFVHSPVA